MFGDLFEQLLELLIVGHGLAHAGFPVLGYEQLAALPPTGLNDIERNVRFAAGATAVGLATAAGAGSQGRVQQPAVMDELADAGTEFAFRGREAGAGRGGGLPI